MSDGIGLRAIESAQPAERLSPSEWADGRVALQDGLTPKYQLMNAPWQIAPLDAVGDPDVKECVYLAPIGTGKTTFMEAAMAYVIAAFSYHDNHRYTLFPQHRSSSGRSAFSWGFSRKPQLVHVCTCQYVDHVHLFPPFS